MKKMLLIMAMAALVCWLPGQALASYTSTLDTVGNHDSTFDVLTNYGTVTVNWIDYNDAKVTVAPLASPDFDFKRTYSAFLNVNGTASVNDISLGWISGGAQSNVDVFGNFDVSGYNYFGSVDSVTFTLHATGTTTWADAAAVLAANPSGYDAAAYVVEDSKSGDPKGYVGERASAVPVPPSVLLMGSGLLGLGLIGWRKKG